MPFDGGGNVLGCVEPVFGIPAGVFKPGDIQIVAARGDLGAGETAEAAFLALIGARGMAKGIIAKGSGKDGKISFGDRAGLAIGGCAGAHVIDPHGLGRIGQRRFGGGAGEEQDVGFHPLGIEDAGGQAQQFATAVRPAAALKFDPSKQYQASTGLIDQQPEASPQTKKRNAVIPAIRPFRPVLRAWAKDKANPVGSRKTAWRIMRRTLGLSGDVFPKTIRHTIATILYADETVPEREIVELLGHEGKLARTTRIYAKYDPTRLRNVTRVLTALWVNIHREAKAYGADHLLTTGQRGSAFSVVVREKTI